jgi:hypothetical protein
MVAPSSFSVQIPLTSCLRRRPYGASGKWQRLESKAAETSRSAFGERRCLWLGCAKRRFRDPFVYSFPFTERALVALEPDEFDGPFASVVPAFSANRRMGQFRRRP